MAVSTNNTIWLKSDKFLIRKIEVPFLSAYVAYTIKKFYPNVHYFFSNKILSYIKLKKIMGKQSSYDCKYKFCTFLSKFMFCQKKVNNYSTAFALLKPDN